MSPLRLFLALATLLTQVQVEIPAYSRAVASRPMFCEQALSVPLAFARQAHNRLSAAAHQQIKRAFDRWAATPTGQRVLARYDRVLAKVHRGLLEGIERDETRGLLGPEEAAALRTMILQDQSLLAWFGLEAVHLTLYAVFALANPDAWVGYYAATGDGWGLFVASWGPLSHAAASFLLAPFLLGIGWRPVLAIAAMSFCPHVSLLAVPVGLIPYYPRLGVYLVEKMPAQVVTSTLHFFRGELSVPADRAIRRLGHDLLVKPYRVLPLVFLTFPAGLAAKAVLHVPATSIWMVGGLVYFMATRPFWQRVIPRRLRLTARLSLGLAAARAEIYGSNGFWSPFLSENVWPIALVGSAALALSAVHPRTRAFLQSA